MKQSLLNYGYKLSEYLLMLEVPLHLQQQVNDFKNTFAETFDARTAVAGSANILIVSFHQYNISIATIITRLKVALSKCPPVMIHLNGFSSLPSHTINISIANPSVFAQLTKNIKQIQSLLKPDNEHKPFFVSTPYLTLAQKLAPWQYEQGWNQYQHESLTTSFISDRLMLLEKQEHQNKFKQVASFSLTDLHSQTFQSTLF